MTPRPGTERPGGRESLLGVALAVLGGVGVAVQSRLNGTLAEHLGSGFAAAVVSFGSGLVVLALALALWPRSRAALRRVASALRASGRTHDDAPHAATPRLRWWECVGGAAGGFFVATQGLTVGRLGVAVFIVAIVAGQSVSSLVVDRLGLAPGGVRPITVGRALGPALTVVAVLVSVGDRLGSASTLALAALPVLAGAGSAWQQAVNGRVRAVASDAPGGFGPGVATATFLNFLVGTTVLVVALAVSLIVSGVPSGRFPAEPWLYAGGVVGIGFIGISAAVVHRIGVLLLSLGMIAGQIVGAVAIDAVTPGARPPGLSTYAGAGLTLVAVALPALAQRRRGGAVRPRRRVTQRR
ncbi:DMT family transporter [Xylanimonas allomyrinae]|uniref:DMT family transporter n=1 Tax=Xylanimonas allomyrinae TaxID=2509459 RepID=A0A4P6EMN3_9MICO|nr:DMT family transporter [Xylanimonas allomyrinae]QAY63922.1 DMT family transporter [Xylanimonas allomyrinae]